TLGLAAYGDVGVKYALALAGAGILASIIGVYFVRGDKDPQKALNNGTLASAVITVIAAFVLSNYLLGSLRPFISILAGLVAGLIIGRVTEYYTSADYKPVKKIAHESETGTSTNIIGGLSVGMMSTAIPIIVIC